MIRHLAAAALCAILLFSAAAHAADPLETLRDPINEVLTILKDPTYKDAAKREEQRDRMWSVIRRAFDFTEIAKRALAADWKRFDANQRKVFTDLFADLLGSTYLDKIQGEFQNEEVAFLGENRPAENKAVVQTKVMRETVQIPVDYSMHSEGGEWRVYDVNVEGVSLVKNYRTQFRKLLLRESPDDLIQRLQKKVDALKAGRGDASQAECGLALACYREYARSKARYLGFFAK